MSFLRRVFGGGDKKASLSASEAGEVLPRVSPNRYWRCPNCGGIQSKKDLDTVYLTGSPITGAGTASCSKCGREHHIAEVYGGGYDFTGAEEVLSRAQIGQKYLDAEITQDADALEALLAAEAVHVSMRGETAGAKAIADRLRNPSGPGAGMAGRLQWDAPVQEGSIVRIEGKPKTPNAPFAGLTMTLAFNQANKISRIEMRRRD